jgi:hypothetical protein
MNIYTIELIVWIVLVLFTIFLFRKIPAKMKETESPRTKSALFTLLIVLGIPSILVESIGPILIIAGDYHMPAVYKYVFSGEILVVIIYFLSTQRSKKS